ncbi:MAG: acetyl-CoA hydrolase [Clostridia bacterium]|nr:acetyl-CoA hydrolase [Clostridia bacterium]
MDWKEIYKQKLVTAEEAVKIVKSGDRIYTGTASSTAYGLLDALWERRHELEDVTLCGSNGYQYTPCYYEKDDNPFRFSAYFIGVNERAAMKAGRPVDFTSVHLSFSDKWLEFIAKPDICFLEVSKPDKYGYVSFGPSNVAIGTNLLKVSKVVIAQVNSYTPYVFGDHNLVHISELDYIVEKDVPYANYKTSEPDEISTQIASHILKEIPDGATFQLGIGNISTAIGYGLKDKNDLGVHTELLNQPMIELMKSGNITNKYKGYMNGKSTYSFAVGAPSMYEELDYNPKYYALPFYVTNDPRIIAQNKNMISINSAMAINIFGEVCADCINWKQQSGTGGQVDFVKGAQWAEGGKSIIATQSSIIKNGKRISKILPFFEPGTVVTTARSDVQYVATEYGCYNIKRMTMRERIEAIISLAHPDFREELRAEAKKHGFI